MSGSGKNRSFLLGSRHRSYSWKFFLGQWQVALHDQSRISLFILFRNVCLSPFKTSELSLHYAAPRLHRSKIYIFRSQTIEYVVENFVKSFINEAKCFRIHRQYLRKDKVKKPNIRKLL